MKNILFFAVGIFFSCQVPCSQEIVKKQKSVRELTKLEQLYFSPKYNIYDFYDLSNQKLTEIPDLSEFTIKKLDLSYNNINKIDYQKLPRGIKSLNLSNNIFTDDFFFESEKIISLEELDVSHNKITSCLLHSWLKRIHLNNNNISYMISFGGNYPQYLNISNNPKMSNVVGFRPEEIDTIIRTNIKNNKKLIFFQNTREWRILCDLKILP